jgi:saccharopine dehydrogenase-like NADP-dependent oxidoreductase
LCKSFSHLSFSSCCNCAKAEEDGRTFNVEENVDTDNLTNNVNAISQGSLVEVDNEWEENVDDSELISEEELEALIQQKIDSEKKQIEYDMEEKYEIRFRKQQVELMHTFDKMFITTIINLCFCIDYFLFSVRI